MGRFMDVVWYELIRAVRTGSGAFAEFAFCISFQNSRRFPRIPSVWVFSIFHWRIVGRDPDVAPVFIIALKRVYVSNRMIGVREIGRFFGMAGGYLSNFSRKSAHRRFFYVRLVIEIR